MATVRMAVVAVALLVVGCAVPASSAETNLLVEGQIRTFDYDPRTDTVVYFASEQPAHVDRDAAQLLATYDVATGEETVIDDGISGNRLPWVGVGVDGEVYLLDTREMWNPDGVPERYLRVYRDGEAVGRYALSQAYDARDCAQLVGTEVVFLGAAFDDEGLVHPQFALPAPAALGKHPTADETTGETTAETNGETNGESTAETTDDATDALAHDLRRCGGAPFAGHLDVVLGGNLQHLDVQTFRDTLADAEALWANEAHALQFREAPRRSLAGVFGNQPCERVYDHLAFEGRRYAMGSCYHSIHAFPSSGHLVNERGGLLYLGAAGGDGRLGIYALEP